MESLDNDCPVLQTDVITVENIECRTPSPVTSCAGSDYSISAAKTEAVEERNDVMLRLMGHLIPDSIVPEEVSPSETDTSIVSSASTLKHRLHNLPTSSEAVKLADRVAALNRRIRRERDLYLHLQGLTNRIEEKDEGDISTTDSSKTVNSTSKRHQQSQINNARARRRQRLYSDLGKLQHQMSSDLQFCSPDLSSPEPLTLKEIQEDLVQEMEQISSPIKDQYFFENDPTINFMRDNTVAGSLNTSITQEYEMADEIIRSCQNASQFSNASYTEQNFYPVVSDCENPTAVIDGLADVHAGLSNSDFAYINYFKDFNKLSSEAKDARVTTTMSSTVSPTGADYPYVTRKRTPTKFGGYRPSSGLILRNLTSDSESDATSERIVHKRLHCQKYQRGKTMDLETYDVEKRELRDSDFASRNFCSNPNRITDKTEILKARLLSPELSADRRHSFEESNASQRSETDSEVQTPRNTGWAPIPPNGKNCHLDDDSGNLIKQNNFGDGNAGHFHKKEFKEDSFTDSFGKEKNAYISGNLVYDTNNENSLKSMHHVTFPPKKIKDIRSPLTSNKQSLDVNSSRDTETFNFREDTSSPIHGPASVNLAMLKSSDETSRITNNLPVLASVKSLFRSIENSEDLRNRSQNHDYEYTISNQQINNDPADDKYVHPKIPPLEIESRNCSQSTSLPSETREDETTRSSLDVNALIQALSDVSLKQKNSTNCTNRSIMKLKSPLGYGNRFSGSSGPRSSEYTPALGGSRQSLTSLEVSETHSIKISKEELTALRQSTPLLKSNEHSARSAAWTDKVLEDLSRPSSNIKKSSTARSMPPEDLPIRDDLFRETSFIPLVAKIDRTNLVCARHPLKIKSMGKLISPRKYQNTDNFREEIVNPLTSRTDISQSSKVSRNSFRSLKSVQPYAKVHKQKIDGSQSKMGSIGSPAPLSGRRVLEPLNLVPKIKPELLTSINRRKKIANDLSEIINSQSEVDSERIMTAISRKNSSRRSPLSRTTRTDLPIPRIGQRKENPIVQSKCSTIHNIEVLNNRKAPGEPFDNTIKLLTEQDNLQLMENSNKGQKYSSMSSEKSFVALGNVLHLRSERLSMSSGDYEGNIRWSPSPRDEKFTKNDISYNSEDKLYDLQEPASVGRRKKLSETMDPENMTSSNFDMNSLTTSVRNCIHLNDLQDGREVTLPCGSAECQEDYLRKKELFNRLPNEIGGSLTRNTAFGTCVAENLHSTKERPSTIEDLRKNIQENNDRWIRNFKNDDESENPLPESSNGKVSSNGSSLEYGKSKYRSLLSNQSKIPQKISLVDHVSSQSQLPVQKTVEITESLCSRSLLSGKIEGKIDPGKSKNECLSPLYGNIKQESEYNSEPSQINSQRSSLIHSGANCHQNTHRSVAESTDSTSILKFDETLDREISRQDFATGITEPSEIMLCNFEKVEGVNFEKENIRLCDIQVISSTTKEAIARETSHETPFSMHPSDATSDSDKRDIKELQLNVEVKSNGCDSENQLANESKDCESSKNQTRCSDIGSGVCVKITSPNSTKSAKPHIVRQHHQDGMISSPVSIKSFSSMSKLNLSVDSKWDAMKKSQDRFPFTISEGASRKTSKFKVVADVSLGQLIQDQNAHAKPNSAILMQHPIISAKSGDQGKVSTDMVDSNTKIDSCKQSPIRQLTPFLEEFSNKISNVSPDNWDTQTPFIGLNYMSYGCREEPRTLMPTVKEMVKKISAKLRYSKTKRCQDPEETEVKILYKNKNCRGDFGEGSSSAASSYQSQLLNTNEKLGPSLVRQSNDGSRASSGKEMTPKRNHQYISMSMQHSPPKGCDQNDLWIQEFDSDVEFDILHASSVAYCQMPNDLKTEAMPRTSSPVNDRYSMFLARRKLSGIIREADHNELSRMGSVLFCGEGRDSDEVNCKRRKNDDDELSMKVPEMVLKSPKTPANSSNDNTNDFEIYTMDGSFEDSTPKSGCCCFKIYSFFIRSRKRSSKIFRSIKG